MSQEELMYSKSPTRVSDQGKPDTTLKAGAWVLLRVLSHRFMSRTVQWVFSVVLAIVSALVNVRPDPIATATHPIRKHIRHSLSAADSRIQFSARPTQPHEIMNGGAGFRGPEQLL